jgi:acyl carrier protein
MHASKPAPDPAAILGDLQRMLVHELDLRIDERDLTPTVPLLDGGLMLDSMVLFELINLVEQRYALRFPDEDLSTERFTNLTVLAEHIVELARRGPAEPEPAEPAESDERGAEQP